MVAQQESVRSNRQAPFQNGRERLNGHHDHPSKDIKLGRELVDKSSIPDPLEGVVPGENRHERYINFTVNVLGKIWPENSNSGEYGDDFWRASRFNRGDLTGYTQFSPQGVDPLNLNAKQFETVVENLGTADYVRVRSVPSQLLAEDISVARVGGSCVIETWGMRTLSDTQAAVQKGVMDPSTLTDTARAIASLAPTVTHLSGGLLNGQDVSVHYEETDMWAERLVSYGIAQDEADGLVRGAYDRISAALERKTKLIHGPEAVQINVDFDELHLSDAIEKWFAEEGIKHDPTFRIVEVLHTYVGKYQKEQLEAALTARIRSAEPHVAQAMQTVIDAQYHLRGKQVDHLRWGSMNLPKEVIVGIRDMTDEEQAQTETDYPFYLGIAVNQDVFKRHTQGSPRAIAAGFADLPGPKNAVQHESRDVGVNFTGEAGTAEFTASVEASLTSPARLHNGNVVEHVKFLGSYVREDISERRAELIAKKKELNALRSPLQKEEGRLTGDLKKVEDKMAQKQGRIEREVRIVDLINTLTSGVVNAELTPEQRDQAKILYDRFSSTLEQLQQKTASELTDFDRNDLIKIPTILPALSQAQNGERPVLPDGADVVLQERIGDEARKIIQTTQREIDSDAVKKRALTTSLQTHREQHGETMQQATAEIIQADAEMKALGGSVFPLSDNPFVHHAMQFLWDSDFGTFLKEAVAIQEHMTEKRAILDAKAAAIKLSLEQAKVLSTQPDKEAETLANTQLKTLRDTENQIRVEASNAMRSLMRDIYPKLGTYIGYLYGHVDYDSAAQVRDTKVFQIHARNGHHESNGHTGNGHNGKVSDDEMVNLVYNPAIPANN